MSRGEPETRTEKELLRGGRSGDVVVLDTRPAGEYAAGHIAGALSMPVDDLEKRLKELPRKRAFVAYGRGPYCIYADRAVTILRASGRRASRLREGFPEWQAEGLPVESQVPSATDRTGDSLHAKLLGLADDVEIYPAHLAGSACGPRPGGRATA